MEARRKVEDVGSGTGVFKHTICATAMIWASLRLPLLVPIKEQLGRHSLTTAVSVVALLDAVKPAGVVTESTVEPTTSAVNWVPP